ncbi:hypothetical protein WME97_05215 [Sorangium sp. So ce367]|uniref:hypothetical protein n=1 Tax=Sorangium sp. So ce367 TaxID=3133305 RepID=UPI003F5F2266
MTSKDADVSAAADGGNRALRESQVLRSALVNVLYGSMSKRVMADGKEGALFQIFRGADAEFHALHPELRGQPLKESSPEELKAEWAEIYRAHSRLALQRLRLDAMIIDIGA